MLCGHIRYHSKTYCYFLFCFQTHRDGLKSIPDNGRSAASWFKNKVLSCTTGCMVSGFRMDWIKWQELSSCIEKMIALFLKQLSWTVTAWDPSCIFNQLPVTLSTFTCEFKGQSPQKRESGTDKHTKIISWFHGCNWMMAICYIPCIKDLQSLWVRRTTSRILTFKHL